MVTVASLFLIYAMVITGGDSVSFETISFPADHIKILIVGIVTSTTLVIPGVDFAVTLMALGYYYAFIDLVGNFAALNLSPIILLAAYLIGYGIGSFALSKGLRYLIKRFPRQLHCVNLAMVAVAPIIVVKKCLIDNPNEKTMLHNITWKAWVWAFIMFAAGYFAFTWVPMLCRYLGLVPKHTETVQLAENIAARTDVTIEDALQEIAPQKAENAPCVSPAPPPVEDPFADK